VTGLGVGQRDDPVGGGPLVDHEPPVARLVDVLADHRGQQFGRRLGVRAELGAAQREQRAVAIPEQAVDQLLAGGGVVPVAGRLAWLLVVVVALQPGADLCGQLAR
jgi:hypothetical protein